MRLDVLLVEDDQATGRILIKLLESVGIEVQWARTVVEATLALTTTDPSLIVLDLMLPDGSGVDVLKVLREKNLRCKVAVVSASLDPQLFTAIAALKPDVMFNKPLAFSEFFDWISSIFTEDPAAAYPLSA